ncbi:alanine:cation symporter family protein [Nanchangia anserum]|uniref:alanine/glycine:cation symporter family protein n=1 Tax=Nanchangia anserum TaxID=2692125 RepID=UPI00188449C7|nr:alanine/glycine:cation symporter family protein [Nanchangia anserum]QOX81173.1 alanine:cation symporter family protein [Nanchangia anserum]
MTAIYTAISSALATVTDFLYSWGLVFLLICVGIGLTVYLGAPQLRHAKAVFTSMKGSRHGAGTGISAFQAFAMGVATRVGIGNIGGVALALILGGPGAIFWMWIVALIGMATAFAESTLAQLFKTRHADGTFRGGPAYYLAHGAGWKKMGWLFALFTIFASGMTVPMVQINTVSATAAAAHGIPTWVSALVIVVLIAPVIIGGVRGVARVAELLGPVLAGVYILTTLVVIVTCLFSAPERIGNALASIVTNAFGLHAGVGGVAGAIFNAVIMGGRRGLFSNEAGLGTAPNAAGAATVAHPVSQGFIQSLGVFIDTIVVCTCTALLILIAHPSLPTDPGAAGSLTASSVAAELGGWTAPLMTFIIFIFGYTSAFGAYSYGQVCLDHVTKSPAVSLAYRIVVTLLCGVGAMAELTFVWALSDLMLGLAGIINMIGLIALARWVKAALADWTSQRRAGARVPVFVGRDNPLLPGDIVSGVWDPGEAEKVASGGR